MGSLAIISNASIVRALQYADAEPDAPPLARRDQREWLALALGASCAPRLLCDAQRRRPLGLHGSAAQGETPRRPTSRLRAKGGADCATPRRTDGGICGRDTCVACVACCVSASYLACVIPARWHFSTKEFVAEERQGEQREQGDFPANVPAAGYVREAGDTAPVDVEAVHKILSERDEARAARDWNRADALRDTLADAHGTAAWSQ